MVLDKWRMWRAGYTGITGLGQFNNNVKMIVLLLGPFLGMWIGAQIYIGTYQVPDEIAVWILFGVLGAWALEAVGFWAYTSTDANHFKVLPQTPTHMPDGEVRKFTFKIPPEGITKICDLHSGAIGAHIQFEDQYLYHDKRMPFPYPFKSMYCKIPAEVGATLKFTSSGEFWHKGMVVETPNCEHVSFYVRQFVEEHGQFKPVAVMGDCTFRHQRFIKGNGELKTADTEISDNELNDMLYKASLGREAELIKYAGTLEERIEGDERHARKYHKSVTDGINTILEAIHVWDELEVPLIQRIFTWRNIVYALIIIGAIVIFLQFFMGVKLF